MAKFFLNTEEWIKLSKYVEQRGLDRRLISYYIKMGYIEIKRIPEYDLVLVRIGSEKGAAAEANRGKVPAKKSFKKTNKQLA